MASLGAFLEDQGYPNTFNLDTIRVTDIRGNLQSIQSPFSSHTFIFNVFYIRVNPYRLKIVLNNF